MLAIEQIRIALKDRNLAAVSVSTGLSYSTVRHVVRGGPEPAYSTVKRLSDYIETQQANVQGAASNG